MFSPQTLPSPDSTCASSLSGVERRASSRLLLAHSSKIYQLTVVPGSLLINSSRETKPFSVMVHVQDTESIDVSFFEYYFPFVARIVGADTMIVQCPFMFSSGVDFPPELNPYRYSIPYFHSGPSLSLPCLVFHLPTVANHSR